MFRKYERTFRLPLPTIEVIGKHNISSEEISSLLTGQVTIEEKIDGANTGIIGGRKGKEFRLQKRGSLVDTSEHPQFQRFKAWTNERYADLMNIKAPYIVYGELMWATHHIYYDALPDWFICFDVWDGKKYVDRQEKERICADLNIEVVPLLFYGNIANKLELLTYVRGPSAYSTDRQREGCVVKNYRKQMRAKIVIPEFVKEIEEDGSHWSTHWESSKINKLRAKA